MVVNMVVAHNLLAMNANRQFNINTNLKAKSTEKLSSGYKINRAADDAAGLSISEKMRWQIRGLNRGAQNIQDGISLVQVADGALNEVHSMVHRIRELAIQAANGTNSDTDRGYIQSEIKEIKKEISRTFNTTDFNGMEIFRSPYTLGVANDPTDIKVYNVRQAGSTNAGGGLRIDDRRYTWSELGIPVSDGKFTDDFEIDFDAPSGERINIIGEKDMPIDTLTRIYQVESDNNGIYVNNMPAARWQDTPASGSWAGVQAVSVDDNTYSFVYNGVDISFTVEEGDDKDTIINKLNPDPLSTERTMYYTAVTDGGRWESAVVSNVSITPMILDVTEANKADISNYSYKVSADETGVTITQTIGNDNITHKKINWEDFTNVATGEPYPFADWGLSDGGNPQTFSSKATYKYSDDTTTDMETAISFTFTVKDEASRDGVIAGLNGITLNSAYVVAPLNAGGTTSNEKITLDSHSGLATFEFERDVLKRTFDNAVSPIEGDVVRARDYYDTVDSYIQTHTMKEVYVRRINEVLDAEGNVDPTQTYYTEELYTAQSVDDTGEETDSEGRTIRWSYEQNGTGDFALYIANGTTYNPITGQLYEADTHGTTIGNDDEHTKYAEATGSSQKYVVTAADTWSKDKTYRLFKNDYDYKNSEGTVVMEATGSRHIDMRDGVVDWKGRPVDTSSYGKDTTFTITNYGGSTSTYTTQFANESITLVYSGTDTRFGGESITMTYNNSDDATDGSTNASTHTKITPSDEATRTFTKSRVSGGSSYRTDFNSVSAPPPTKSLHIQAGSDIDNGFDLEWNGMSLSSIGLGGANVSTEERAIRTIGMCDTAIEAVSEARSTFGAYQNRLEHSFNVNKFTEENLDASESRIRDTDMAEEMVRYTKQQILEQAVQSMLVQANQSAQGILNLLNG